MADDDLDVDAAILGEAADPRLGRIAEVDEPGEPRRRRSGQRRQPDAVGIVGDEDDPTLEPALYLKRAISTSALLVMPKCGHTMNLEDPDAFNRAVLDFVTQVDCGRWQARNPDSLTGSIIAAKK